MINSVNEVGTILNRMVTNTLILLTQNPKNEQKLREIWIETGIMIDEWNAETRKILAA